MIGTSRIRIMGLRRKRAKGISNGVGISLLQVGYLFQVENRDSVGKGSKYAGFKVTFFVECTRFGWSELKRF